MGPAAPEPEAARLAAQAIPSIPRDADGPVFREPWEARAFAMALALQRGGLFTWGEWAATLGDEIAKAQGSLASNTSGDPGTGHGYYRHWLAALERIVAEKDVASPEALAHYYHAWEHAAERTPHGKPIELQAGDFHG